ncbi:MAG: Sua5/YciO/YrdC/YwlC family protein, partial [Crocosphaera sp.]
MPEVSQQQLITGAKQGKVVSFPTDTVPALAALPDSASLIFATKKRPPDKPLILMG